MFLTIVLPALSAAIVVPWLLAKMHPKQKNSIIDKSETPSSTFANFVVVLGFNGMAIVLGFLLAKALEICLHAWHESPDIQYVVLPQTIIFCIGTTFLIYGWTFYLLQFLLQGILGKEKTKRFLDSANPPNKNLDYQKMEKYTIYYVSLASFIGFVVLYLACTWYVRVGKDSIAVKLPLAAQKKLAYQDLKEIVPIKDKDQNYYHVRFRDGFFFSTKNLQWTTEIHRGLPSRP